MIIISIATIFWGIALFAHAMLQPKFLRVQGLAAPPRLPLHLCRIVLPGLAAFLCCQLDLISGVLVWFGSASIAGIFACAFVTLLSIRGTKPDKVTERSAKIA
ncbi:hypothetical protein ABHV46_13785 [Asaia sp. BMEF1]|uniref:hypothetical protein n=1 Tax=unclassified Asaia TaxID=2685023 RepID=UPI00301B0E0A